MPRLNRRAWTGHLLCRQNVPSGLRGGGRRMKPGLWPEGPGSPHGETKLSVTEVQWWKVAVGPSVRIGA